MPGSGKYNAQPVTIGEYRFDSIKEANRYRELVLLEMAGEVTNIIVHPKYELQPAFSKNGKSYRAISYEANFQYKDLTTGKLVVEDVKGFETEVWKIKQKIFLYHFPGVDFRVLR